MSASANGEIMVYVAGPYRAETPGQVAANVGVAADMSAELMRRGYGVTCPHTMTHNWELYGDLTDDDFLRNGLALLRRADVVLLLPGSAASEGSRVEFAKAKELGMAVYASLEALVNGRPYWTAEEAGA